MKKKTFEKSKRLEIGSSLNIKQEFLFYYPPITEKEYEEEFGENTLKHFAERNKALNRMNPFWTVFEICGELQVGITLLEPSIVRTCVDSIMMVNTDRKKWKESIKRLKEITEKDKEWKIQQPILSLLDYVSFMNYKTPYTTVVIQSCPGDTEDFDEIIVACRRLGNAKIPVEIQPRTSNDGSGKSKQWYDFYKKKCNHCGIFTFDIGLKEFRKELIERNPGKKFFKKLMTCGRCKKVYYCSPECQKNNWVLRHRKECKKLVKMTHSEVEQYLEFTPPEGKEKEKGVELYHEGTVVERFYNDHFYLFESERKNGEKFILLCELSRIKRYEDLVGEDVKIVQHE